MKVALVNLCKIEDFARTKHRASSFEFLAENNIEYVDYVSGRSSHQELLAGFHEALRNPTVDLIWFIQGGNTLITFLDAIDWNLVAKSTKEFFGLSDFTHFSLRAAQLQKVCYYGQGLKRIKDYLPLAEDRQFIVDFLKEKKLPSLQAQLLYGQPEADIEKQPIIGGYSIASAIMLPNLQLDLNGSFLFFEHHYVAGENISDVIYFAEAVKLYFSKSKPKGIILGHSMTAGINGDPMEPEQINEVLVAHLSDLKIPIYYADHFKTIIQLGS